MTDMPLVSIAAINYNNSKYVIETLESIKAQTYANIELILVDDCSTDDSVALINQWLKSYPGKYKFIEHKVNKGVHAACNTGIRNATGKYYAQIATDDVMMPEKTAVQVKILEETGGETGAVYSDAYTINEESVQHGWLFIQMHRRFGENPSGNIYEALLQGNYIPGMTFMFKRSIFDVIGLYDETLVYEDYDMWLRIARRYDILFSDFVSVKYRMRQGSLSSTTSKIKNWNYTDARIFLKHVGCPLPVMRLKKISRESYISNDAETMPVIGQLAKKTGDRYLKAAWLLWKHKVDVPTGLIILNRVDRKCNIAVNKYKIDIGIYKDIYGAIKTGNTIKKETAATV